MLMRMVEGTGMLVFAADSIPEFSLHTFELSFHFMSALPHSFLVRGWLEAFVVCDLVVAFALCTLGGASAARDGRPQTLEFSFHTMPDISHPNRVKGCGVFTEFGDTNIGVLIPSHFGFGAIDAC
jgi:hypothetical protein